MYWHVKCIIRSTRNALERNTNVASQLACVARHLWLFSNLLMTRLSLLRCAGIGNSATGDGSENTKRIKNSEFGCCTDAEPKSYQSSWLTRPLHNVHDCAWCDEVWSAVKADRKICRWPRIMSHSYLVPVQCELWRSGSIKHHKCRSIWIPHELGPPIKK